VIELSQDDARFPLALLRVRPQPERLFAVGDLSLLERPMAAIVGSRRPTPYGTRVAYEASRAAAEAGIVVVSGMARGLDARAHQGALDAGGATVAVLGCGMDVDYPRANRELREAVRGRGLILTEYRPDQRPTDWTFPLRNRLIAALARCVLVVEGKIKGGTSNMAHWATQLGKTIFAVPGRLGELEAEGPNSLIHSGAKIYLSPADLLHEFGLLWKDAPARAEPAEALCDAEALHQELTGAEATLFDLVRPQPRHVDELGQESGLEPSLLLAALSSLELKGLVSQLPGKRFVLAA
jgi:DNA processing protein